MESLLDNHPHIAACAPALLDYQKRDHYEYAGAAGGFIDKYGYTFCRGRIFDHVEKVNADYQKVSEVFWATGACLALRAEAFQRAGGFDEGFFAHMEEVDLCWRLKNMGYRIGFQPDSSVYHVGGGSLPKNNPLKTYLNYRNNLFMLYKNVPRNKSRRLLFIRLLLDLISAAQMLARRHLKDCRAVLKAHRHFFRDRNRYKTYIKKNGNRAKNINFVTVYPRSIVIDYFIRGRKTFGTLSSRFREAQVPVQAGKGT